MDYVRHFKTRFSYEDIIKYLEGLDRLSVLILGEAVVDEYVYGEVIGKTNKSPSLVFSPKEREVFAGVPMNVANHLATFCSRVDASLMVGDGYNDFITDHADPSVSVNLYRWDAPTIVKRRYIATYNNSKVFEVYDFQPARFDDKELVTDIVSDIDDYDLVIVCDSGHGMFTYDVREALKDGARFLAVNTQMNAGNVGTHSVRKYIDRKHDIYVCVNEREFRLATHELWDRYDSIDELLTDIDGNITAITTGPSGCKMVQDGRVVNVPAFAKDIVDTVGAGDAFLALSAPLARNGAPLEVIGFVGNVAGAIKTTYQGNKESVNKRLLQSKIKELLE